MAVFFESAERKAKQRVVKLPLDRRSATAKVAARHLELHAPVDCCGFGSLYDMWKTFSSPELFFGSTTLRPEYFAIYFLMIAWLSVVLARAPQS